MLPTRNLRHNCEHVRRLRARWISSNSIADKDWGDVICWVLPQAKVDFLLKDLKKKDDILAKLATLPSNWTTYISRREALPAAPTPTKTTTV
jgi:hypothetical protein